MFTFIESKSFGNRLQTYLDDSAYSEFQRYLAHHPCEGKVIRESGGLRKIRWGRPHGGKSGGLRFIYYFNPLEETILLLALYAKNEQVSLSKKTLHQIRKSLNEIKKRNTP